MTSYIRVAAIILAFSVHAMLLASDTENGACDKDLYAYKVVPEGSKGILWRDCVGQTVEAHGFAWGGKAKPYALYLVLDGERIFLSGSLLPTDDVNGRPVKVIGKMKVFPERHPNEYRPPIGVVKRYVIIVESMSRLDRAERVGVELLSDVKE